MRLLWVKTDYLHPTRRGGQIRTLEILKLLHRRHEVHYVALDDGSEPEGPQRAGEYCSAHFPVPLKIADKRSLRFVLQLVQGLFASLPVAVSRYQCVAMKRKIEELEAQHQYDAVVCDFPFPAPNLPRLETATLFQHNVEARIWRRRKENAPSFLHRWYYQLQERRMAAFEGDLCRVVKRVIAVSESDALEMQQAYGRQEVAFVPTGVDTEYFSPHENAPHKADLVFVGSMDWMPNIDGAEWFCEEVLPLIRQRHPDVSVALVGRRPSPGMVALGSRDPRIVVTGTVDDVRPWLHGSLISIVPLRIGGGTRLKIYEAMAAGIPVISTSIGAEGLDVESGKNIILADEAQEFAAACCDLLSDEGQRWELSQAGRKLVVARCSWESVTDRFEHLLFA